MAGERATERKLIFTNLANGVPVANIARDFHKQEYEVMDDFRFVVSKIKSYGFERAMPYIPCETVELVRQHRLTLFSILEKLNLDSAPLFPSIKIQPLESIL